MRHYMGFANSRGIKASALRLYHIPERLCSGKVSYHRTGFSGQQVVRYSYQRVFLTEVSAVFAHKSQAVYVRIHGYAEVS